MYLDYILFSIGGILLFLALAFAFALLRSRKRSLAYRRVFREETERIDVITTLKEKKTSSSQDFSTHSSHALPATEKLSDLDKIVLPERVEIQAGKAETVSKSPFRNQS